MFVPTYLTRRPDGFDPRAFQYTVVDLETTGKATRADQHDRVCEVAAVRMRADGTVLDELSTLVHPDRPILAASQQIHGIDDAVVAGAPRFAEIAGNLLDLMRDTVVVTHNRAFDEAFLGHEFARLGLAGIRIPGLCTLATVRGHTDLPGYRLAGVVKSLSGAWPKREHNALDDCRSTGRVLATLLATGPTRLTLTPTARVAPLPARSSGRRLYPRMVQVRSGPYTGVENLAQFLPAHRAAAPASSSAGEEYAALVLAMARSKSLGQHDAARLASAASEAGLTRGGLAAAHLALWQARHHSIPAPVGAADAKDLHHLAKVLGVTEQAADRLPPVTADLKGWRIVPLGTSAEVREVASWAGWHGATVGVRPSKTTRLLIAEANTEVAALPLPAGTAIPVLAPEAAKTFLKARIAESRAEAQATQATKAGREDLPTDPLIFPTSLLGEVWRRYELPGQATQGTFTPPVRWLVEQASDPTARFASWQQKGGRLGLRVRKSGIPAHHRRLVAEAQPVLEAELRRASAVRITPAPRRLTSPAANQAGPLTQLLSWVKDYARKGR
ncbi:3'-5' exonuclease [Streptacidiphilus jiangxiensis]|uniref:3'-5' exonuclease n=1 Tax=Streptacidiphilus jiangxiensis TaxID=235985 RepID=UPI0006939401|nr:3'-5' exonuclease [Streptacidiphilus jiangxiensis]